MISVATRARVALLVAVLLVPAGCSSVVTGEGATGSAAGRTSSSPDFPSSLPETSTAPASTPAPATSASSEPPTASQREEVLVTTSGGDEVSGLIAVPGGYEAASFDQIGNIRFWFDPVSSLAWRRIGVSRYPYVREIGPPEARVRGALLRRMQHATFIVTGLFTGDGSGNAVAFTTGPRGWGAIKAEASGNIGPSGRPVGRDQIGLSYGFAFSDGYLVTADCPLDRPISDCDTHQIRKRWIWAGSDFHRV